MRRLLVLLLLIPLWLRAATGSITGIAIESNGWIADVYIENVGTNGTFAFGFGTNNTIVGTEKLILDLTSMAYDNTGAATTAPRRIYGTLRIRFPYNSDAFPDVTEIDVTNAMIKVSLSEFVYQKDSNIVATVAAGLYTSGGASLAASGVVVTNGSTQAYPKVVANWSYPGWNRETGATMRLRAVGFHQSAREGKPLAAMKFIATDESGDSVTSTQTGMMIDRTLPDKLPFGEYVADISQTTFLNGDNIRCDFIAYPWIGDSGSVLDTTLNTYALPMPSSITNLCDKNNTYGDFIAVVASVAGAAPRVTNCAPALVNPAHYFGTGRDAFVQLAASNNLAFGHNDVGGSIVYLNSTCVSWSGGTAGSVGGIPKARLTIKNYPGDTVVLTSDAGTDDVSDRLKFQGLTLTYPNVIAFNSIEQLWFDQCVFNSPSATGPVQSGAVMSQVWVTHSNVGAWAQGLGPHSSAQNNTWFVRGCDLDGFNGLISANFFIGNSHNTLNGSPGIITYAGGTQLIPHDWHIVYNNWLTGTNRVSLLLYGNATKSNLYGAAIVQNIFESCGVNAAQLGNVGGFINANYTNLMFWNNLTLGERIAGMGYNDTGSSPWYRNLWSIKGNVLDVTGFKTDTFTPGDGGRIGNWPVMWQVGGSQNSFLEVLVSTGAGLFDPIFNGINSLFPSSPHTNSFEYWAYVDRKSYAGDGLMGVGNGNYKILSRSPGTTLTQKAEWLIPFDIEGNARGGFDPPGAYSSASPRKGGFF